MLVYAKHLARPLIKSVFSIFYVRCMLNTLDLQYLLMYAHYGLQSSSIFQTFIRQQILISLLNADQHNR